MHCIVAATRHLAKYALEVARKFHDGADHDNIKVFVIEAMVRIYAIMDAGGQFLSQVACTELAARANELIQGYSILNAEAHATSKMMWAFSPKFHLSFHLCVHQTIFGNPRYHSCYSDEDLVGLSIEVAESCHVRTLAIVALCKWLILAFNSE